MLPNAFDMHAFLFGVLLVITGAGPAGNAAMGPQDDYWSRIEAMAKKRVPGGNPELLEYLRSLSRDQMLVAARQCAAKIQKVQPVDTWGPAVGNVWLALRFYGKPHECAKKS